MKKFRLWLPLFSLVICLLNIVGLDDKNLLLFFSSPHLMLLEDYSYIIRELFNELFDGFFTFEMIIWYLINILGWFLIGWFIDIIITILKRKR